MIKLNLKYNPKKSGILNKEHSLEHFWGNIPTILKQEQNKKIGMTIKEKMAAFFPFMVAII